MTRDASALDAEPAPVTGVRLGGGAPRPSTRGRFQDGLRAVGPAVYLPWLLVVVLFAIGALTLPAFVTRNGLESLLVLASFLGLAAVGQTLVVIVGGVDLSIPAVMGLADVVVSKEYAAGHSFGLVLLLVLCFAVLVGVANGLATVFLKVHPLIVTLSIGLVTSGGVLEWSHGSVQGAVPKWLTSAVSPIGRTGPIPVPALIIIWVVASAVVLVFLGRARLGREIYATGANPSAARRARVRTTGVITLAFVLSAVFAAVVGIAFAGYSGAADATVGDPYLFQTISAVVIGGTSLLGGRGGYGRTIAGTLAITELTTLLVGAGFDSSVQEALLGVLVIVLVVAYGRESPLATRV